MVSYVELVNKKLFGSENERSSQLQKNIIISSGLKGGSVLVAFFLVPITINYINPVQYGIWLTISSMIYWISVFDIGIGNGLKNEIAHALAVKDEKKLSTYVSTSYAVLSIIAICIFVAFLFASYFINWNKILDISATANLDIRTILILFMGFFCVQFVAQLLDAVLSATQQVFVSSLILFLGQLAGLILIYVLTLVMPGSLTILVLVMAGSSLSAILLATFYLYNTRLKKFSPQIHKIDFTHVKKILNVGGSFFLIQIASIILIHANNFIITSVLGPESVTTYYIPFRLFSVITMIFTIIITPYWSAFTDAYATGDFEWIKSNIKKLRMVWLCLALLGGLILLSANFIYNIWIDDVILVPMSLSVSMLFYVLIYAWQTLHVIFLNGIGKIKLQLFVVTIGALINIPLSIFLGKKYGLIGIVNANSIVFLVMALIFTIQYEKIVAGSKSKIWNR